MGIGLGFSLGFSGLGSRALGFRVYSSLVLA